MKIPQPIPYQGSKRNLTKYTQATLPGRDEVTYESAYLSPGLLDKLHLFGEGYDARFTNR